MPLSHYALDNFVAPKLSLLTICGMQQIEFPDVPFAAVVLNQIFLFVRPRPAKQIRLVTNMFRWMDAAFVGYAGARESLSAYTSVERGRPSMPEYFLTISLEAGKNTMSEVTAAHARDYESFTTHLST